jgi:hypothetical protein
MTTAIKFRTANLAVKLQSIGCNRSRARRSAVGPIRAMAVQPEFGYVVLTAFASVLVHHVYMTFNVARARKK